jgi:hypothetical protein
MKVFYVIAAAALALTAASCSGGGNTATTPAGNDQQSVVVARPPVAQHGDEVISTGSVIPGNGGSTNTPGGVPGGSSPGGQTPGGHDVSAQPKPRFANQQASTLAGLAFLEGNRGSFMLSGDAPGVWGPFDLWQWYVGAGQAPRNIQGEMIDYAFRSAALLPNANDRTHFADMALDATDNFLVPHVTVNKPLNRGYAFEVGALLAAAEYTGDATYAQIAANLAMRTVDDVADGAGDGRWTGSEYADRFITNRKSLGGWDAGPYFMYWHAAGVAVGGTQGAALTQWATDGLDQMWARRADWELAPWTGQFLATHMAWGMQLQACATVDPDGYSAQCDYYRAQILAEQNADGYWVWGYAGDSDGGEDDLQATYSCLLGLDADGDSSTIGARKAGEDYLCSKDIQQADGGFNGYIGDPGPLNNSLAAEAFMGLAVGLNRGNN